jgi:outer membrane protein OmpA-like peptidoglycan-associated protein
MKNISFYLLSALLLITSISFGQEKIKKKQYNTWTVGAGASSLIFLGDVKQNDIFPSSYNDFNEHRFGAYFNVSKQFDPVFGLEGEFSVGSLAGFRQGFSTYSDLKFESTFRSADLSIKANISTFIFNIKKFNTAKFQIFTGFGVGLTSFRSIVTQLDNDSIVGVGVVGYIDYPVPFTADNVEEKSARVANYYKYFFNVNYALSKRIELSLDLTKYNTLTNDIDVTESSPNDGFNNAEDGYFATSLGLKYNFGKNKKNLQWYNPLSETYHSQARTRKQIQGLRKDTDNDGVADQFDADPNTPDNISVDGSGKPLDVDMDGVFDYLDADPFSSKGAVVDENGLEIDSDGDGIGDSKDLDSNTKPGVLVNQNGEEVNDGTPSILPSVYFNPSSVNIKEEDLKSLAIVAKVLLANVDLSLNVVGHTDSNGSIYSNNDLGLKRAESVKTYLVDVFGISQDRLFVMSKGETMPLVINSEATLENVKGELSIMNTIEGINRRVDFVQP